MARNLGWSPEKELCDLAKAEDIICALLSVAMAVCVCFIRRAICSVLYSTCGKGRIGFTFLLRLGVTQKQRGKIQFYKGNKEEPEG
jgi:hypothetical protein